VKQVDAADTYRANRVAMIAVNEGDKAILEGLPSFTLPPVLESHFQADLHCS
jgi:hypothetical protein